MIRPRAAVSWSGGKDCCLALYRAREHFDIAGLLTVFTEDGSRTRSHGLRPEIVQAQARVLDLPLLTVNAAWPTYEVLFERLLKRAKNAWNITHAVFGDVFPDAHKKWAEETCRRADLAAVEPLWNESTADLAREFIRRDGRAVIVAGNESRLGADYWLGRTLDGTALDELQTLGADPGGENGEFHTLVTRFPDGDGELALAVGARLSHGGCALLDLRCTECREEDRTPSAANDTRR